jgi:queuine tRNA-ribosyltransferase
MRLAREAIIDDRYPQFVKDFFAKLYQGEKGKYPAWCVDALSGVGVDLLRD